jgi:hypothetical protein
MVQIGKNSIHRHSSYQVGSEETLAISNKIEKKLEREQNEYEKAQLIKGCL